MKSELIFDQLNKIDMFQKAISDYKSALSNYKNYLECNNDEVYILVQSKFQCRIDYNYIESFMVKEVERTFSELKKLEII